MRPTGEEGKPSLLQMQLADFEVFDTYSVRWQLVGILAVNVCFCVHFLDMVTSVSHTFNKPFHLMFRWTIFKTNTYILRVTFDGIVDGKFPFLMVSFSQLDFNDCFSKNSICKEEYVSDLDCLVFVLWQHLCAQSVVCFFSLLFVLSVFCVYFQSVVHVFTIWLCIFSLW